MAEPMKSDLQRAETHAYAATGIALALLLLGTILQMSTGARSLQPALVATAMTMAISALGAFRLRLARRQQDEESAVAAFRTSHTTSVELFADADEAVKVVSRANRTYVAWFLPVFTVLVGGGLALGAWSIWHDWTALATPSAPLKPLLYAGFASPFLAAFILAGSYFSGVSREPGCRWLRPVGSWLLFTGVLYGLGAIALVLIDRQLPVPRLDMRAGRIGLALLILFGAELLLNVIVDLYRPRILGEVERPVTESRLLTLVTEPGGIARNVAAALDYQFGFQVTDAWFYRFLERTVVPFMGLALALFWLMSSIVVIQPQQCGIHQRWGRVLSEKPLLPGLHLKWPWPIDTIHLFPVERVQEVAVGYDPDGAGKPPSMNPSAEGLMGDMTRRVIVWN